MLDLTDGPWTSHEVECLACGAEWVAVYPLGVEAMECPGCGGFDTVWGDAPPRSPCR